MPVRPDLQQLEKCIDDAFRKNDFKPLKTLLQIEICEDVKIKCSKQFFHKLDDLICRELNKKDIQTVSLILVSFGRCGRNISILGQAGLLTLIKQGLVQKEIILSRGNSKDEAVINMIEDLFDLLMVIYDISDEGKRQVVEGFIPRICALVIDSRVNFYIQQETLKRMNAMLDKIPQDAKEMLINQEMLILMNSMGRRILDAGDYDLQVGIIEALYRMTTEKQRRRLVPQWFSMDFIANAFKGIKDSEFETDCRMFLNLVNGMLGDKRRVFTFPCLSAFLDKYELQIPSDEKLEEFWIDFNLGSQTLSFYVAGDHDDHQWEAVTVSEEEVQIYSIEERESKKLLTIITKNIFKINKRQGEKLLLHFDASLEITNVLHKIYGTNKHKEFTRKQGISVAKTSVHILFDASGSQILVPESQISPVAEELINLKEKPNSQEEFAKPPKYIKNSTQGDRENSQPEIITPSKRKMSEASVIVTSAERYKKRSPLLLIDTSTPRRGKIKPPLQVMSSAEKPDLSKTSESEVDNALSHGSKSPTGRSRGHDTDKHIKTANIVEKTENKDTEFLNKSFNEPQNIVPDSQAVRKNKKPMLPGVSVSMNGNKMPSKLACWTPVTNIKLCNNQRASTTSQGDAVNQDSAINKKITKEKSSSSISDDNSEAGKVAYKKEAVQRNKANKAEGDVYRRSDQQLSQRSGQKNSDDTKQSDWHIESETTFKSVHLNKTAEESPFYGKKNVLSKGVNTAICDKSPPRKSAKSYRKPRKRLTSELNSWDLKQKKLRENSRGKALTDAAESLISQINERYKTKDDMPSMRKLKESLIDSGFSSKSDLHLSKEKVQKKCYRQLKTTFVNTSKCSLDDVYNFNLNGADEPVIKLGIQECQATVREACVDSSIKLNHDELESSLQTKNKRVVTSHKNKKLFSDSDTEYRCDDDKSDISWLREPKSKPQLIEYGRNRRVKGKQKSRKSRPSLEREQPSSKMTPKKNITKKVDETIPDGRTRLPRRATNTKKYYKDLSNSESECEQEVSQSLKETLPVKESHLTSPLSVSSEGEKIGCDVPCDSSHVSGPTHHLSRKRMYIEDSQINSEGLEEEEEGRANLFPPKLSKIEDADHQVHQISESTSPLSTNDSSNPAKKWETEISGASVMCEQFNTEFKRNCNTPQNLMDYFTKQSWKTVQQHLKIMNHHIQEYRIKKLDKFQFSIIDELENFERDSQALKDLEKESVDFWEKTVQKFSAYQKSEQERVHLLKASLDKNVFYNTNQEETLCTSEICFMKENLKVLQDSLLQKMQEEELLSLRRGLLSLFMAPEADVTVDI